MSRPTVADLRATKGRQRLMLRVTTLNEAAAAEAAGIDIVSVPADIVTHPRYREVAPSLFSMTGLTHTQTGSADDYLRFACQMMEAGADALYCSGSLHTIEHLAREYIPVVGHLGLVPARATWTGGFRAVAKTAAEARVLLEDARALHRAGAFAAEIEVVPPEVASAVSARTPLLLWSMGAGAGCDAQYLFAEDVLGAGRSRAPRHAKVYANLAAEEERLQHLRVAAFKAFAADVASGAFPEPKHLVRMDDAERQALGEALDTP